MLARCFPYVCASACTRKTMLSNTEHETIFRKLCETFSAARARVRCSSTWMSVVTYSPHGLPWTMCRRRVASLSVTDNPARFSQSVRRSATCMAGMEVTHKLGPRVSSRYVTLSVSLASGVLCWVFAAPVRADCRERGSKNHVPSHARYISEWFPSRSGGGAIPHAPPAFTVGRIS